MESNNPKRTEQIKWNMRAIRHEPAWMWDIMVPRFIQQTEKVALEKEA